MAAGLCGADARSVVQQRLPPFVLVDEVGFTDSFLHPFGLERGVLKRHSHSRHECDYVALAYHNSKLDTHSQRIVDRDGNAIAFTYTVIDAYHHSDGGNRVAVRHLVSDGKPHYHCDAF